MIEMQRYVELSQIGGFELLTGGTTGSKDDAIYQARADGTILHLVGCRRRCHGGPGD